jgi:tRNA 2-thiouridine synthesizing protein A
VTEGCGQSAATAPRADVVWDAGDLACGDLILQLRGRMEAMSPGQVLRLVARDSGAPEDLPAWCRLTGHTLLSATPPVYLIRRKER